VFSELDESRRSMLMGFVTEEVQTFITATDVDGFDESLLSRAHVVKLEEEFHA
jgi:recombinational DNA repair ATPase RecF